MGPTPRLLAVLLVLGTAAPARADAMRCGTRLVAEGDTAGELVARCGAPSQVDRRTLLRPAIVWHAGRPLQVPGGPVEVAVETWTYNLGPHKLMRRVRLEDGVVRAIETLGYGFLPPD